MSGTGGWVEVVIAGLGSGGDGVAETPGGPVYVPYGGPGDRVRIRNSGKSAADIERVGDGPLRQPPACAHFERCGGCALQHVADDAYVAWKRDLLIRALQQRGIQAEVAPMVRVPPGTRRRARLSARVSPGRTLIGFKERGSHRLVDLAACPVMVPDIVALLPALRKLLSARLRIDTRAEISVSCIGRDLDVSVDVAGELDLAAREALAHFAETADLARLSWGGEVLVQRRPFRLEIAGIEVDLPPAAFLQATAEGEEFLRGAVARILSGAKSVADLYAGCGALGLGLVAAGTVVQAVELRGAHADSLVAAARRARLVDRFAVQTRDLARQPLAGKELKRFDGVVLDPPRAGAIAQVQALAASQVPRIAYVSCNPASFARDARVLLDGGYRLESIVPVDQFPWSPHLELVADLVRE